MSGSRWPARYEIRVDGVLDDQWADWFGGLQLSNDGTQTIIVGLLPDQSALDGVGRTITIKLDPSMASGLLPGSAVRAAA